MNSNKPQPHITIKMIEDGPIVVRGAVSFISSKDSSPKDPDERIALCRCGRSVTKPFCSGQHMYPRIEMPAGEIE